MNGTGPGLRVKAEVLHASAMGSCAHAWASWTSLASSYGGLELHGLDGLHLVLHGIRGSLRLGVLCLAEGGRRDGSRLWIMQDV